MGLYSDKLWAADRLIREYNKQLGETEMPKGVKPQKSIDSEKFIEKLVLYGGVADELLRQCTWEDLENCGLPRLLSRKVAKIFRKDKIDPNYLVRRWMPILKKWGLHWRDHTELAEKLEDAVAGVCDFTSQVAIDAFEATRAQIESDPIFGSDLFKKLELIRDDHLEKAGRSLSKLLTPKPRKRIQKVLTPDPGDGKIHQFYKVIFTDQKGRDEFIKTCSKLPENWNESLRWMMDAKDSTYLEGYVTADIDFVREFEAWLTKTTGLTIE